MLSNVAMTHPAKLFQRRMPASSAGFKWQTLVQKRRAATALFDAPFATASLSLGLLGRYAMNMRAADAIVSSVPKAMNTFPISEVSSQTE
jgi:hypothetical protein